MKLRANQSGFSPIEVILVIVVIGLLGVAGWFVYDHQKKNEDAKGTTRISSFEQCVAAGNPIMESYPEQCAANGKTFTKKVEVKDETVDWTLYKDRSGKYSLKYPGNWVIASNLEYCSEYLLLLGVKMDDGQSSVGKCGSGGAGAFGQISISWRDDRRDLSLCGVNGEGYKTDSTENVTVSGAPAIKTTATYIASDQEYGSPPKDTKITQYCFIAKNLQYIAAYSQWPQYPDALKDFDLMVTKTLTVN